MHVTPECGHVCQEKPPCQKYVTRVSKFRGNVHTVRVKLTFLRHTTKGKKGFPIKYYSTCPVSYKLHCRFRGSFFCIAGCRAALSTRLKKLPCRFSNIFETCPLAVCLERQRSWSPQAQFSPPLLLDSLPFYHWQFHPASSSLQPHALVSN